MTEPQVRGTDKNEAPGQPLESFLTDAGMHFEDIPVAMQIHRAALDWERRRTVEREFQRCQQSHALGTTHWHPLRSRAILNESEAHRE